MLSAPGGQWNAIEDLNLVRDGDTGKSRVSKVEQTKVTDASRLYNSYRLRGCILALCTL
jgi:hypothetical protein